MISFFPSPRERDVKPSGLRVAKRSGVANGPLGGERDCCHRCMSVQTCICLTMSDSIGPVLSPVIEAGCSAWPLNRLRSQSHLILRSCPASPSLRSHALSPDDPGNQESGTNGRIEANILSKLRSHMTTMCSRGGAEHNPGEAHICVKLANEFFFSQIGHGTDDMAEWLSLLWGMSIALDKGITDLDIIGNSQLVINQALGTSASESQSSCQ